MANLQVKDIDEKLYESLRNLAANEKRSISQEVVYILQKYLSKPNEFEANQTDEFLKLAGSWKDERAAEEIISEMKGSRKIQVDLEKKMNYLIDTDILIYSMKGKDKVVEKFRANRNYPKAMSVITYGELIHGARKSQYIEKNLANVRRLVEIFPIINITPAIMETFGDLKTKMEKAGRIIDDMDLLNWATALSHNLILVTNNIKHFEKIEGLELENWSK